MVDLCSPDMVKAAPAITEGRRVTLRFPDFYEVVSWLDVAKAPDFSEP